MRTVELRSRRRKWSAGKKCDRSTSCFAERLSARLPHLVIDEQFSKQAQTLAVQLTSLDQSESTIGQRKARPPPETFHRLPISAMDHHRKRACRVDGRCRKSPAADVSTLCRHATAALRTHNMSLIARQRLHVFKALVANPKLAITTAGLCHRCHLLRCADRRFPFIQEIFAEGC